MQHMYRARQANFLFYMNIYSPCIYVFSSPVNRTIQMRLKMNQMEHSFWSVLFNLTLNATKPGPEVNALKTK
jgi:hypothetical protein